MTFEVPKHYCAQIHLGMQIGLDEVTGDIFMSPCNIVPVRYIVTDNNTFNHPHIVEFRKRNKENQKLEGHCEACHEDSCTGKRGQIRSSSNIIYLKDKLLYDQPGPKTITFKFDYTCNLACVICGPELSTKWRSIEKVKGLKTRITPERIRELISNINLEQLETVHIYGGEPLLGKTHEVILEELIPYGKNITVWYDTNATVYPSDRSLELWSHFHLVRIKFSIDGVGKSFEYLRWPANWAQVQNNMLKMYETLPVNHMFSFRPTIGLLNFSIVKDIRDWMLKYMPTNRLGDITDFEYNPTNGPYHAGHMSQDMLDEIHKIYAADDPILGLIPPLINDPTALPKVKANLEALDRVRGLDWKESFPHLIPHLSKL